MSHSTHNRSLWRWAIVALVLTTKNNVTKHYTHKTALANKTIYILIWYAFYNLQPGNE